MNKDDLCHAKSSASGETSSAQAPLQTSLSAEAWQPIETAPKDGTEILMAGKMNVDNEDYPAHIAAEIAASIPIAIGRWVSSSGCTVWEDEETTELRRVQVRKRWTHEGWNVENNGLDPTHWMPLPQAPKAGLKSEATPSSPPAAADHDTKSKLEEAKEIIEVLAGIPIPDHRGSGWDSTRTVIMDDHVRRARSFLKENGNG